MSTPFTYNLLKRFAGEILASRNAQVPITQSWCQRFSKRHNFSHRKARHVERVRAVAAASPVAIIEYFEMLEVELTKLDLNDKPLPVVQFKRKEDHKKKLQDIK